VSDEDLSFKVVKDLGAHDELLALAATMPIARRAFQAAVIPARRSSYANAPASWSGAASRCFVMATTQNLEQPAGRSPANLI
jgi:hypothetical protein